MCYAGEINLYHTPTLCVPESWNWATACIGAVLERRQAWAEKEVKLQTDLMRASANPTGESGNKVALQSYAVLDQESWHFIPPIAELLNAGCPRQLSATKTESDHFSYWTFRTSKEKWEANLHAPKKCLNPMFKRKNETKSIHLFLVYIMRIISTK